MNTNTTLNTQKRKKNGGFTLIEVIAVLVLLGILAAIALPKYIDLTAEAKSRAIDAGVAELNGREALAWGQVVLGGGTFADPTIDTTLGSPYTVTGTTSITFDDVTYGVSRTAAVATSPGTWVKGALIP